MRNGQYFGQTKFESPRFQRETLFDQNERIEVELEETRLDYALRVAQEGLRWFDDQLFGGKRFDLLEAEVIMSNRCTSERVAPEFIPAVVDLVKERYGRLISAQ